MPVCPECQRTWPAGVVLCRDCRATLVEPGEGATARAAEVLVTLLPALDA